MSDHLDAIETLHTALIDSREGYKEALDQAEPGDLTTLFSEMRGRRTQDAQAVAEMLAAGGRPVDATGSIMGSVHRTVIYVRSLVTGLDESVLGGIIDGEERILDLYDRAIAACTVSNPELTVLTAQHQALARRIAELKDWRTRVSAAA